MADRLFDRDGAGNDFEEVRLVRDAPSGLRAVICIHATRGGLAAGGIRRASYATDGDAFSDALALAGAMTRKLAIAGVTAGGAKTVMLDRPGVDRPAAYRALGRAIDDLGGRYLAGPDVGTGPADIEEVRSRTRHVNPEGNDPGAATAAGVLAGMRALLAALDGDASFDGRRFVVQGLGAVGREVARGLLRGGATVLASDVNPAAARAAEADGVTAIEPGHATSTACDVFVPCALGGVITPDVARVAPWQGVCGSANHPLADARAGVVLSERGIVYVPDFVVNSGAVVEGVVTYRLGRTPAAAEEAARIIRGIEARAAAILEDARASRRPPEEVAEERACAAANVEPTRAR